MSRHDPRPSRCAAALVCLLVVASTGCGVPVESSPQVIAQSELPAGLRTEGSIVSPEPEQQETVSVWFVHGEGLASASHSVPAPAQAQAVIDELLAGPTESEQNRSLRSAIPDPAAVPAVVVERGVATVSLTSAFSEIPANDQVLAVGQLVLTLTDLRGIGRVRFVVDDVQVAVPLPNREVADDAVSRDDYAELAATT